MSAVDSFVLLRVKVGYKRNGNCCRSTIPQAKELALASIGTSLHGRNLRRLRRKRKKKEKKISAHIIYLLKS